MQEKQMGSVNDRIKMRRNSETIREEIWAYIRKYIARHVYAPTVQEIAENVEINLSTARRHLQDMLDKGVLETDDEKIVGRNYRVARTKVVIKRKEKP